MIDKIPTQREGGFSDNVSKIELETVADALLHFEAVKIFGYQFLGTSCRKGLR